MKSVEKLVKLADKFSVKYAQEVSQGGTTELFFDSEQNQRNFVAAVQQPNGPLHKILLDYYSRTSNQPASFTLTMSAEPKSKAYWNLDANPPSLKKAIWNKLNETYQKIVGTTMEKRQAMADAHAKAGGGSGGPVPVGSLEVA